MGFQSNIVRLAYLVDGHVLSKGPLYMHPRPVRNRGGDLTRNLISKLVATLQYAQGQRPDTNGGYPDQTNESSNPEEEYEAGHCQAKDPGQSERSIHCLCAKPDDLL